MESQTKKAYFAGYHAFDRGDYLEAIDLATQALTTAEPGSYWYWGALGLRCWATNFAPDEASVKRDAQTLIASASGPETLWFQGLAHLNLGLLHKRLEAQPLAHTHFLAAHTSYEAYQLQPGQPASWAYVKRFFAGVALWAAEASVAQLQTLLDDISASDMPDDETAHLVQAIRLYLQHAEGKPVRESAICAVENGVSRTFLAHFLI